MPPLLSRPDRRINGGTNYTRGEMSIEDHSGTFGGFMRFPKYGGGCDHRDACCFPILTFGAMLAWPTAADNLRVR